MYKPVTQVAWEQRQEEFWSFRAAWLATASLKDPGRWRLVEHATHRIPLAFARMPQV